jgi:GT2 family glycosyltransferase
LAGGCRGSQQKAALNPAPLKVTACLLSWKRHQNLPAIVASLRDHWFIDEILVWNNDTSVALTIEDPKVSVIDSNRNMICFGRYLCASQARNAIIYVQDDDAINRNISGLYSIFCEDPNRVAHAVTSQHYESRHRCMYGEVHNALVGWGAFFLREWLSVFDQLPAAVFDEPLFLREADKIFTMLLERRHNTVGGVISLLPGHSSVSTALWQEPPHQLLCSQAVSQTLRWIRTRRRDAARPAWNVVITCHNYGEFVEAAVTSVLANDADYEITIVDDASTDDTPDIAADLARRNSQVTYFRSDEHLGTAKARNRGVEAVESDYVLMLDADDMIGPDYLFEATQLLSRGTDVVNPDALLFGRRNARWVVPDVTTLQMLLDRNWVHCCSAFRHGLWSRIGGLDERMPCWMDYDFWIRAAAAGAVIRGLHGDHFYYRQHGRSLSDNARVLKSSLQAYLRGKHARLLRAIGLDDCFSSKDGYGSWPGPHWLFGGWDGPLDRTAVPLE